MNHTSIALIKISLNFNHVCVCSICPKLQVKELNEVIKVDALTQGASLT
jgi:hypothetical protein